MVIEFKIVGDDIADVAEKANRNLERAFQAGMTDLSRVTIEELANHAPKLTGELASSFDLLARERALWAARDVVGSELPYARVQNFRHRYVERALAGVLGPHVNRMARGFDDAIGESVRTARKLRSG